MPVEMAALETTVAAPHEMGLQLAEAGPKVPSASHVRLNRIAPPKRPLVVWYDSQLYSAMAGYETGIEGDRAVACDSLGGKPHETGTQPTVEADTVPPALHERVNSASSPATPVVV